MDQTVEPLGIADARDGENFAAVKHGEGKFFHLPRAETDEADWTNRPAKGRAGALLGNRFLPFCIPSRGQKKIRAPKIFARFAKRSGRQRPPRAVRAQEHDVDIPFYPAM